MSTFSGSGQWEGFNGHTSPLCTPPHETEELAALCHPNWGACDAAARKLHRRNCQQILGQHLDAPVGFVIYWAREEEGVIQGGTATAVTLARHLNLPTFNLHHPPTCRHWSLFSAEYL